ncbi:MAG: SGNH/GDSL hydrolase family protein [Lachnospiraceae bacterium]
MKILFQGDSVTDCGRDRENALDLGAGYASKVAALYNIMCPNKDITFINKGVSGDRTCNLLLRYQEDVLKIKPDIITILIGINDTWRRYDSLDPTSLAQFERNYEQLLSDLKRDLPHTKIIMIEPFLLNSMEEKAVWREDLDPKIQCIRKLARKYGDKYLALDGILQQYVVDVYDDCSLSLDGVHPTELGHAIIAKEVLKVLSELI